MHARSMFPTRFFAALTAAATSTCSPLLLPNMSCSVCTAARRSPCDRLAMLVAAASDSCLPSVSATLSRTLEILGAVRALKVSMPAPVSCRASSTSWESKCRHTQGTQGQMRMRDAKIANAKGRHTAMCKMTVKDADAGRAAAWNIRSTFVRGGSKAGDGSVHARQHAHLNPFATDPAPRHRSQHRQLTQPQTYSHTSSLSCLIPHTSATTDPPCVAPCSCPWPGSPRPPVPQQQNPRCQWPQW